MAEKRSYTVPLRRGFINTPKYYRAKKAVSTLRAFIQKHMKVKVVRIGPELNKQLWARGIRNPVHKVKVSVFKESSKDKKGKAFDLAKVELEGVDYKEAVKAVKEEKQEGLAEKIASKITGKETPKEVEKAKEANATKEGPKSVSKKESKEERPKK
ncbi:MAG TPA: 50S ribosomal protein L31e [Candidatus Nanoarchaeia archaeon]|nr:50S ribosomal protein L31e [Candidatus Nanoarchaeia archaeon]